MWFMFIYLIVIYRKNEKKGEKIMAIFVTLLLVAHFLMEIIMRFA